MIKHNYQKHRIMFKLEKNFSRPTVTEIWLCGKESIQTNFISFHNSENICRLALCNYSIQVNYMAKGGEYVPSGAKGGSQSNFGNEKLNSLILS